MIPRLCLTAVALLALAASPCAQLRLPAVFGDHMVLQQATVVPLWGWDEPGQLVTVRASWSDEAVSARAGASGRWQVQLTTAALRRPQTLTIEGSSRVQISDVLLGEVWIASGQSNMEWSLGGAEGGPDDVAAADHQQIRIFNVAQAMARAPQTDCTGQWQVVSPETIESFSAVAYHFGRELHTRLDVPVGLIGSNWGGTVVESWMSEGALTALGEYGDELARIQAERLDPGGAAAEAEADLLAWWEHLSTLDEGASGAWADPDLELGTDLGLDSGAAAEPSDSAGAGGWWSSDQPGTWHERGLEDFDGIVWMRREVEIPAAWAGRALRLELGPVDDVDSTWFAGEKVGGYEAMGAWSTPRVYEVPGRLVRSGRTVITVRAVDTGGPGGFLGPAESMRLSLWDGSSGESVSLAGPWVMRRGAPMSALGPLPSNTGWFHQNRPTALFNGMIAPLVPFGIRGAIFYQGESNVGRAEQYARLFPAMIENWREVWGRPGFPFYYVQIAPFRYGGDGQASAWLREAQRLTLATENTGMAVTLDIGNPDDIHPLNKRDVGHRLALWALAQTYGDDELECSGPLFRSSRVRDRELVITFDHGQGLHARGEVATHFEIGGADGVFYPASAEIVGETVVLSSPAVSQPTDARFAWSDVAEPNLFNGAGLPASSFQTRWNP